MTEVEDKNGKNSMFTKTFTFHVGPDRTGFNVHVDVVAKQSEPLNTLMNGSFRESRDGFADLPDVEAQTFTDFLAYAYFISNGPSVGNSEKIHKPLNERIAISKVVESLLKRGHRTFKCKGCYRSPPLRFARSFPHCLECGESESECLVWNARCVVSDCSEEARFLQGLMCETCLSGTRTSITWESGDIFENITQMMFADDVDLTCLSSFGFEVPRRVQDILRATKDLVATLPLPFTDLLGVVKLAAFAEMYEIPNLMRTTTMILYQRLARESPDEKSVSTIIEVTNIIYRCTPDSDESHLGRPEHVLRRMMSEFIAAHRNVFLNSQDFKALFVQEGDLSYDVFHACSQGETQSAA